ncbi:hypothetical protein EJ04DRAFT_135561, partial [Polyplosphaeria fusca]
MSLSVLVQSYLAQSFACCFPWVFERINTSRMAPIAITPPPNTNGSYFPSPKTNGGPLSPTAEAPDGMKLPKFSSFRESMTRTTSLLRPRFGRTTSVAFDGHGSVHDFLRMLKNERFRYMPHDGSNWDKVLKWADNIGGIVLLSHGILNEFMLNSEDATRLVCDSCTSLIQLGSDQIKVLLKVFSVFHKMAFALSIFLKQNHLIKSTSDVRRELAHAYQQFAHLTFDVMMYCNGRCRGPNSIDMTDFDSYISQGSASFYAHLEGVSTSMWTSEKRCSHFNIHEIREFLSPQDSIVKTIMSNQLYSEFKRAEFTCEWFAPHLRKFVRHGASKKMMLVTGAACTGKTVLARWIYEKLQESVDDEPYDVITYSVDTNVKYSTSPLTLIKSLLLQLLDRKIGRESLLAQITKAIDQAQRGASPTEVETTLWSALEAGLDDKRMLVLIDGLDQLSGVRIGNPPALEILDRITHAKRNVKAIVLSRPVSDAALKHCQEYLSLEDLQETAGDIEYLVGDFIQHRSELRKLKEAEKTEIARKIREAAKGSFLSAELQLQAIKHKDSASSILKFCQQAPKNVDDALDKLIADIDVKQPEPKHLLSWILAAERPLSLKETKALLEVDLNGCAYRPFSGDVEKAVRQHCGGLVVIRDGLVYLRHPSIRERLMSPNKTTKLAIDLKEAHRELATRSMAYVKIHLHHGDVEPQADIFESKHLTASFLEHDLFEYAARYWVLHFRSSCLYDKSGKFSLPADFKVAFPSSIRLALFEGTCLARQYIACEAEKLQNLAYNIRKTLFGDHSAAVLQSLILELRLGRKFKDAHVLSEYSFEAWKISRHVCSTTVVQALAEAFIEYSSSLSVSTHKEFCSKKEEVLCYLVEVFKHGHRESKEIHYLTLLAGFYVEIHQVQKAVVIYRDLYRLRLQVCGHLHQETHSLFELLITYLKKLEMYEEVLEVYLEYHQHCESTLVITDERRIQATLAIIQIYEERKEVHRAEEILVRFWKCVSTSKTTTTRITELRIDFALKYSKFLYRYSRKEESEVILRGLWTEIQTYSYEYRFESTMIKRLQKIAKYFSKLEIFTMSRSIYQSLYEHFESREERTSTECVTIVRSMAETITKSIEYRKTVQSSSTTTTTTTTTSTTIVEKEETTLKQVFESCMESTEITSVAISVCQALCSSYMHEERYEEACEIYSRIISKVWSSFESTTIDITEITEISEHISVEILELCINLAVCHFKMLHIEIAEAIYFNLFRILICSRHIEDKHFLLVKIRVIIEFFKEIYKYERVIEIYRELFVWMPICFGKTHHETICVLIEFARVCFRMHLYHEAATACSFVYSCFHISHGCLHFDGFEAALLLCEIYEIQCKWELAYEVCGYLWRTFVRFGLEYKLECKVIEKLYKRYMFIMEHHHEVEYHVCFQVAKEYHESCVKFYGYHHETTIRATLAYAHICEKREEHREISISLYHQVIKYCKETKTEFSKKTLHVCNTRVASMYASSTKEITKAVEIYTSHFEECRKTEITSSETLTALHSLVTTCRKQSTTESITKATSTLRTTSLEIFEKESRSELLIESARSIATTYKECAFFEQAETLIQECRTKVVEEIRRSCTSSTKMESKSFVFLASFQEAISGSSSFSEVISELRSEILMYESYFKATTKVSDYRKVIKSGCGLYFHLEKKAERRSEFLKIEKELKEYFFKYLNFTRTVKESVLQCFFQVYLREISKVHYEHEVVRHGCETVLRFTKTAKFAEAYDLVLLIDRFIHLNGGYQSEFHIRTGFNLAKYLAGIGTNKCGDEKIYSFMLDLSRIILQEALGGLDKIDIDLCELQQLLADLISTLSAQKKYEELEHILQTLWRTRTIRTHLSSSPLVLFLGRSLTHTLAALNRFSDAIHLCSHIRYNLAYIRGALDASTLAFTNLLSELYTAQHRHRDAMDLHEDILARLGEGQSAPGLDAPALAAQQSKLLELAYRRHGRFDKNSQHYYDLFSALDHRFEGEHGWEKERPKLEGWTPGVKEGETRGCWRVPARLEGGWEEEESG